MTRAALLHVLDHATAIAPAEVRELEQLAQAFPYCQTAHLLLAKAAHDQGTMLAGQRLRRAATYAADRELLRRLIEQVAPAVPALDGAPGEVVPVGEPGGDAPSPVPAAEAAGVAPAAVAAVPGPAAEAAPPATAADAAPAPEGLTEAGPASKELSEEPVGQAPLTEAPAEDFATGQTVALAETAPAVDQRPLAAETQPDEDQFIEVDNNQVVTADDSAPTRPGSAGLGPQSPDEPALPAAAPPIRPPEETGAARLEFGLAEAPAAPVAPTYELPGLIDEWAAAAATLALAAPAVVLAAGAPNGTGQLALSPAAFTGDAGLGYGLGGGSRLGFAVQRLNSWAADDAANDAAFPAGQLPPCGEFFAPDALLLAHWEAHRPPDLPTAVDLVNNFLRRQPRLTRPAMLSPAGAGAQADLSARSTRPEAELASEGLAQILVRQGKTARAIEIYERLMVKQPEKMAYFAAQIQQLQPPVQ